MRVIMDDCVVELLELEIRARNVTIGRSSKVGEVGLL